MRKRIYIPAIAVMIGMTLLVWKCGQNSPQTVSVESVATVKNNQAVSTVLTANTPAVAPADNHIVTGHAMSVVMPAMPSSNNSPAVVSEAEIRQRIATARNQQSVSN
jgi:hypothetical protein